MYIIIAVLIFENFGVLLKQDGNFVYSTPLKVCKYQFEIGIDISNILDTCICPFQDEKDFPDKIYSLSKLRNFFRVFGR